MLSSHEHRRPLYAFGLITLVAVLVVGNSLRAQAVDALVAAHGPEPLIGALAPDRVLGERLSAIVADEPDPVEPVEQERSTAEPERTGAGVGQDGAAASAAQVATASAHDATVGSDRTQPRRARAVKKAVKTAPSRTTPASKAGAAPSSRPLADGVRHPAVFRLIGARVPGQVERHAQAGPHKVRHKPKGKAHGHHKAKHDRGHGKAHAKGHGKGHGKGHAKRGGRR